MSGEVPRHDHQTDCCWHSLTVLLHSLTVLNLHKLKLCFPSLFIYLVYMHHILYQTDFHSKREIRVRRRHIPSMVLIGIIGKGCGLESKRVSFFTDVEFKIARYHIGSLPLAKNVPHSTSSQSAYNSSCLPLLPIYSPFDSMPL